METELKYRIITKKSAEQLRQEGINVNYFEFGKSKTSRNRLKLTGRGRDYTDAFDMLIKELERFQSRLNPETESRFGLCNIIEVMDNPPEIILRGDLVST